MTLVEKFEGEGFMVDVRVHVDGEGFAGENKKTKAIYRNSSEFS